MTLAKKDLFPLGPPLWGQYVKNEDSGIITGDRKIIDSEQMSRKTTCVSITKYHKTGLLSSFRPCLEKRQLLSLLLKMIFFIIVILTNQNTLYRK